MVSSKAIYGLSKKSLKRKIPITKVAGLTISKTSSEFVVHVPDEYDYRYSSCDKRDHVLEMITKSFCEFTLRKITIFFKDVASLEHFCTTKDDKKKNVNRMPTEG